MSSPDPTRTPAHWRKSTKSGNNNNCVEVATNIPGVALVRDTKRRDGGTIEFSADEWALFISGIHAGEFR